MSHLNVEFKARCEDPVRIWQLLSSNHADFRGEDHQVDIYFNVPRGRLKLREGNIENCLVYYDRQDQEGHKTSDVTLFKTEPGSSLKEILTNSLGVKVVVIKKREIYFIDNVKFHLDNVEGLGRFVEVEAIDQSGSLGEELLHQQCAKYMAEFGITEDMLISCSYSDLLLQKLEQTR